MKDKFNAFKRKLEEFVTDVNQTYLDTFAEQRAKLITETNLVYLAGAVTGSIATGFLFYYKMENDHNSLITLPLGKKLFKALVNDETNFVRFVTEKHDHAFRVYYEH